MTLSPELLAKLTDAQRLAVTHIDGPLLVLAGPGSGKTRVITHRVAYLIDQGIPPRHILAITFTNKAAQEMRQRLVQLQIPRGCTMCTFHSLAARLLREFTHWAQVPANFSIYDESDQKTAMRDAIKACQLDPQNYPPGKFLNHISTYKNDLVLPEQVAQRTEGFYHKIVARIYQAYQDQLTANAALDFDDLLMKLALLLRDNSELRDHLNDRYRYVLIDEYQDTNHCQYQIARGLSLRHNNLCVTGDPDQSIYGWRGADIGNILAFETDYPDARVVRLEENFRSTPQILALADQLIQGNKRRKQKQLFTRIAHGASPELCEYQDEYDEARGMAQWITQLRTQGMEYRQMAVFYRVNSLSRVLEEALRKAFIPYQIVRGVEFFNRREIKDMLAYLKLLVNPADRVSLKRIINRPLRGIGDTTVARLFDHSQKTSQDIGLVLQTVEQVGTLGHAVQTKIKKFAALITQLQTLLDQPVATIMKAVYEQSGLQQALTAEKSEDPQANVEELINSAVQYDATAEQPSLIDYLQQIALMSDADNYDEQAGAVSLMTLHAAKGLEFPAVHIVAVEDGLIPHARSLNSDDDLEEERRLLFVGITRAQQKLRLSYARRRTVMGASISTIRSEFLRKLQGLDFQSITFEADLEDDLDFDDDCPQQQDDNDEPAVVFTRGQLVRHPKLGLGRIQQVIPAREESRVVVQFNNGSRKTLMLKYAKLEILDYP